MNAENPLQSRFSACYSRILRTSNPAHLAWSESPYRDLVCGIWPKAMATTMERALTVFLEGEGIPASRYNPPRGQSKGDAAIVVRSKRFGFRASLVETETITIEPPRDSAHDGYLVFAISPMQVRAWTIASNQMPTTALRIDLVGLSWGTGGLLDLVAKLRAV